MRAHTLIALIPEGPTGKPPAGLTWQRENSITAVMDEVPSPVLRLALDRKSRLLAAAHYQRQLESLRGFGTVLPVKQSTDLRPLDALALIRANGPQLLELGATLQGLDQYQISVAWEQQGVLDHFREAPELKPLFSEPKIKVPALTHAVERLAIRLRRTILEKLANVASDLIELPCDAETLVNLVLVSPTHKVGALEGALASIDAIWTEGLRIRQIGPAAPASFATLHPRWISAAEIKGAFTCLQLPMESDIERVSVARKATLRAHRFTKSQVDLAFRIATASINAGTGGGFFLCDVWRDGTAQSHIVSEDAA